VLYRILVKIFPCSNHHAYTVCIWLCTALLTELAYQTWASSLKHFCGGNKAAALHNSANEAAVLSNVASKYTTQASTRSKQSHVASKHTCIANTRSSGLQGPSLRGTHLQPTFIRSHLLSYHTFSAVRQASPPSKNP